MLKWQRPMLISLNGTKGSEGAVLQCTPGSGASEICKSGNVAGACTTGNGALNDYD